MSVLKRRAELLEQLIASTAHVTPGHPRYEALARSCKEKVEFHSFLDTHPDVVNAEYAQLKERLEDNAQFDKVTALSILSTRLQNLNFVSSQLDFASRQLSFLLAASRNVLRTVADPEILAQAGINNTTVTGDKTSATHPSAWSDDEDDSDAEWWANEVAYSPEDGLSVWSWEDEEEQQEEGKLKSGSRGHDDGGSFLSLNRNGLGVDEATKPFIPDPTSSPLTPLTLSRAAVASPKRHSTRGRHQHHLSPLRRVKQPYSATSLAIWLAAKDSGGHPARQLDPRRCFTDSELVTQVINMLKGLQMPGLAFKFDSESDTYNVCRGVHTSDLPPGSIASLLTTFTALATHLRRIQTFCDAIVFTSTNYQDNKENPEDINALRALPTVGAFAAAVARQVVAIRGQLVDLETASTSQNKGNLNLLFLRLKLALMKRQVAALHAMVKECYWKGTAPCTASALLDSLSSVLETHLMRSGQHSGAVSAMLVEIFCAAWKPLNDALDIWLSNGSLAAAPPEFYIYFENNGRSSSSSTSTFWSEEYRLKRWTREHGNAVAAPSLLAPLAESLLQAGLASVGLTLSTGKHHLTNQAYTTETSPSLHTAFIQSVALIIERGTSAPTSPAAVPRHETRDSSTREINLEDVSNGNNNSNANGKLEDGLWLKEWMAAVARSPSTAMVPLSEDISDLSLFPKSALDLPEAFMCPETTVFIDGNSTGVLNDKEGEEKMGPWKKRHPVTIAMHLASSARALQADTEKTDSVIAAEFCDTNEELYGGALPQMLTSTPSGRFFKFSEKGMTSRTSSSEKNEKIPSDAASWAASLPLQVLLYICLVDPIHKRMKEAENRACEVMLHAGLLPQLATMETIAAAAGPVLEPFVQYLLRHISTPRGVDGVSPFELNASLANALIEGEEALTGLVSLAVSIVPLAPAAATTNSSSLTAATSGGVCSVSSLTRVRLTLHPAYPLNLIATDSFLNLHTMLWTLSLQLQWVAQSLIAARVCLWKESQSQKRSGTDNNTTFSTTTAPSTRAVQQEMLHLVHAVRQHMLTHVENTSVRMRRGIATCGSLREMQKQCGEYEEELRHGCLLHDTSSSQLGSRKWHNHNDGPAASASGSPELHSSLLEVLESSLRHCILLGHARQAKILINKAKQAQLEAEDAEQEALALDSLEFAKQKFSQITCAVAATEREFEGHRVAFMERVSVYGSEAGAHSDAARALLAAVDIQGRWQPQKGT